MENQPSVHIVDFDVYSNKAVNSVTFIKANKLMYFPI